PTPVCVSLSPCHSSVFSEPHVMYIQSWTHLKHVLSLQQFLYSMFII
ncbi:unnamed protein product, partial [Staurois parvus]